MPKFTPVLDFDSISPTTTKGDLIVKTTDNGNIRIGVGADNTVLTANSGVTAGISWVAPTGTVLKTLSGATTLPASSQTVLTSGNAYQITLPTPSGNSGLEYRILKTDNEGTQISIGGTGFIGASLQTLYEEISLLCDGSTYWTIARRTNTTAKNYTPTTFGFGTIVAPSFNWSRVGSCIQMQGRFTCGTIGSTVPFISFPGNIMASTSASMMGATFFVCGLMSVQTNGANQQHAVGMVGGSGIFFGQVSAGQNALTPATANNQFSNSQILSFTAIVPIQGWDG